MFTVSTQTNNFIIKTHAVTGQLGADTEITLFSVSNQGILTLYGVPNDNISTNNLYSQITVTNLPSGTYAIRVRNMQTFQNFASTIAPATPHYYLSVFECYDYASDATLQNVDKAGSTRLCALPQTFQITNLPAGFEVVWSSNHPQVVRQDTGNGASASYAYTGTGIQNAVITASVRKTGCTQGIPFTFAVVTGGTIEATMTGGADVICWGGISPAFTLQGDVPSSAIITWSASPCHNFTVCSGTGTSFAPQATKKGGGNATITVTINAGCGANTVITKNVWIGEPSTPVGNIWIDSYITLNPPLYVCPNGYAIFQFVDAALGFQGITRYEWAFSCGDTVAYNPNESASIGTLIANGQAPCGDVRVRAVNACGASGWLIVDTEYGGNCNNLYSMRQNTEVFSNPANTETNVQIKNLPDVNYNQNNENTPAGFAYQIEVYNKQGVLMKTLQTDKVRQKVVTSDLPKGQYEVLIKRGNLVVNKHLIVNR